MALVTSYYRYRQWINCQGGGYLEDYNMLPSLGAPGTLPPANLLNAINWIIQLRGQLLEGNSKIANGEISIESLPGMNPAEGFNIPHNVSNSYPTLLKDPTTGVAEVSIGIANDPSQCISYRLDTKTGFSELRTLRSIRTSWVNQWNNLYPNIATQLGIWGAVGAPNFNLSPAFPAGINDPAGKIAYFMLVVMWTTNLVQNVRSGTAVYQFNLLPYASPNSSGSPAVINPVIQPQLTRRKVGEGWPKTRGKMQTFGTSK